MKRFKEFLSEARRSLEGTHALNKVYDERPFFDKVSGNMPKLSETERRLLDAYTQKALPLNRELRQAAVWETSKNRGNVPSPDQVLARMRDNKAFTRELDDLIQDKGMVLARPFTTYRGVTNPENPEFSDNLIRGVQHGFLSTGVSPRASASLPTSEVRSIHDWARRRPKLLKINVPIGTRFLPNPQTQSSRFRGENEIVFPRGMHLDTKMTPESLLKFYGIGGKSGIENFNYSMPVHRSRISHRGHS